jgi:hypothetical protein
MENRNYRLTLRCPSWTDVQKRSRIPAMAGKTVDEDFPAAWADQGEGIARVRPDPKDYE